MCGLFGFVAKRDAQAACSQECLRTIFALANERGPDGWGLVHTRDDRVAVALVGTSAQSAHEALDSIGRCEVVVGHCRLATTGDLGVRQPLKCGSGFISHNGNVQAVEDLATSYSLEPETTCDSEVLGMLIDLARGPLEQRASAALETIGVDKQHPSAMIGLFGTELVVAAAGHPLYVREDDSGYYFCSKTFDGAKRITKTKKNPYAIRVYAIPGASVPIEPTAQPVDGVTWVLREELVANDYNPNKMPPPEFELLKVSLLEDGWTQPLVVFRNGSEQSEIIDGFHRWTVAGDEEVARMTGGRVPVVFIDGDVNHRMMSTIRHNRARGEHYVVPMSDIVRKLLQANVEVTEIMRLLQMEEEEVDRLAERAGLPTVIARNKEEFSSGWMPG
jgi:predicted glutamine amidotransferase